MSRFGVERCCCDEGGSGTPGNPCIVCASTTARARYGVVVPAFSLFDGSCATNDCGSAAGAFALEQNGVQWCFWEYYYPVTGSDCGPFKLLFFLTSFGTFVRARFEVTWQIGGIAGPVHVWIQDVGGNPINCDRTFVLSYSHSTSGIPCELVLPPAAIIVYPL